MNPQEWSRIQQGIFAGESGGDYGALFGYQNRPNGRFSGVDLTKMTVDQALDFANPRGPYAQYVKGEVGRVATPMGAYQIVGTTLRAAKEGLGLRGDEVLTPALQDKLGQWIYKAQGTGAWEGYKPMTSAQATAARTSTKGPQMMQQKEQQPRGFLEGFGVQRRDETAGGETAQPFYQRDSFKDTAAILAQGFGRLGIMGMEEIADDIAKQRTEIKAKNKTVEFLRKSGRADLADAVANNVLGARDAASLMFAKPEESGQVVSAATLRKMYPGSEIAEGLYNIKKDGTVNKVGGAPQVVVNSGDKGNNKFAELDAKTLVDVAAAGMQAQRSVGQINRLESLLEGVPTGAMGALKVAAGNFGIQTEGLDDLQAAQALINSLVPQQRPAGSGPMSDADLELFKQSLPRIINSPNGNQIILETMRGIAAYDAAGAEIVQRYRSDPKFTQADAFAALQARPDPFANLNLGPNAPASSGGATRLKYNPETGEFDD
jgi:hypothetical protein